MIWLSRKIQDNIKLHVKFFTVGLHILLGCGSMYKWKLTRRLCGGPQTGHRTPQCWRVDVAFTCQDTIQVPATTSSRGQPRGNCFVVIATSPLRWFPASIYSGYPGGDLPVLDGSQDEPSCPYCVFVPCIIHRPPVFLTGRAAPSLVNDRKRKLNLVITQSSLHLTCSH